jgi:hypothetical protein
MAELHTLLTYAELSRILGISAGTLRNAVCSGRFPRPIATCFGPRFTEAHYQWAVNGGKLKPTRALISSTPPAQPPVPPRRRGRPRIAQSHGKGGVA